MSEQIKPAARTLLADNALSGLTQKQTIAHLSSMDPCPIGDDDSFPSCNAAYAAFRSASIIVLGMKADDETIHSWVFSLYIMGLLHSNGDVEKFQDGLKFSDAVSFLKKRIATEEGAAERALAIDNAYQDVYGRPSTALQQASWNVQVKAQKAWYATIVIGETSKLNASAAERVKAIEDVYQSAMGRMPTMEDMNFWKPRKDHYQLMLAASRKWLYSGAGAKDLVETTTRALKFKTNKAPSEAEVKQAMIKYAPGKLVYAEMIKS